MIRENIQNILNSYLADKSKYKVALKNKSNNKAALSKVPAWQLLNIKLVQEITTKSAISRLYKVEGSIGKGVIADIPWVAIFDNEITDTAHEGYYIVFLFRSDMKGVYLSLNQGWTQYENEYTLKEARLRIKENASKIQKLLGVKTNFDFEGIQLLATRRLGKGYELGNICSKYYKSNELPEDNVIIDDVRNLLNIYSRLKRLVGHEILKLRINFEEDEFQKEIQTGDKVDLPSGKLPRKNPSVKTISPSWVRDPNMAYTALENANFLCENESGHSTFQVNNAGHQFMEAHHLVPMEFQKYFECNIDVPENIISLCPNCHRAFHHSMPADKQLLIKKFFQLRESKLNKREILIDLSKLMSFYKQLAD